MVNDIVKDLEQGVAKAHDSLKKELAKVRTGRASQISAMPPVASSASRSYLPKRVTLP